MKKLLQYAVVFAAATVSLTAMAQRPLGVDVSSYQGSINWSSAYSDGVKWAFAKATEGNGYEDADFHANMNNGKAAGLLMGAYDFAHCTSISPATEANYFWAFAGAYIKADGKSLEPMVDFEVFGTVVGASSYTAWFNAWSSDVKAKTSSTLRPIIYGSAGTGMCHLTTACTLSAWVANYNGENLYTGNPWSCCDSCNYVDPNTQNDWTFWQVSSTGSITGISGNVDLDAYAATLADLKAWQEVGT